MFEKLIDALSGGAFKGLAELIQTFKMPPEEAAKLQFAIQQAEFDMKKTVLQFEVQDRDSARKREAVTGDKTTRQLAWIYTIGYFLVVAGVWEYGVPDQIKEMFFMLMGVLTAAQTAIINYYFGSSHGSASKDSVIKTMAGNGNGK